MPDRLDVISIRSGEAQEHMALVRGSEEMVRAGVLSHGACVLYPVVCGARVHTSLPPFLSN